MTSKSLKLLLLAIALGVCTTTWLTMLGVWLFMDPGVALWTVLVTIAAVSTEAVFWVGGVVLGWTAFSNRARIWRALCGRGAV